MSVFYIKHTKNLNSAPPRPPRSQVTEGTERDSAEMANWPEGRLCGCPSGSKGATSG